MKKAIWKYPIYNRTANQYGEFLIPMQNEAKILSVGVQNDTICLWAEVDPFATYTTDKFIHIVGTGKEFVSADHWRFIGMVQQGVYVWHIYEETK